MKPSFIHRNRVDFRNVFSSLVCAWGVLAISSTLLAEEKLPASKQSPNIVLIVSDDQHWQDYRFMGQEQVRTPNLDRLASQSLLYKRGYVPSSLCCPSLATILTGLYPHQHKITSNDPPVPVGMKGAEFQRSPQFRDGRQRMNAFMEQAPTLPRLLKSHGYRSLQTGKWWQGNFATGGFTDGMTQGDRHGDAGLDIGRKTMEPIRKFVTECQSSQTPFFVWYAPFLPHAPHNAPPEIVANSKPRWKSGDEKARGPYLACIEWFDQTIGELFTILDDTKVAENTLVIYVTDNGWICGDRLNQFAPRSKQSPYDGGVRTPIMLHWPGTIEPREANEAVSSIDIAPTILKAVGLPTDPAMQGVDLLYTTAVKDRRAIFGECFTHNAVDIDVPASSLRWRWMIRDGMKLIVPAPQNEPQGNQELFEIVSDPFEQHNVYQKNTKLVAEMENDLNSWWSGSVSK